MRKVITPRIIIVAALLLLSLSAFSVLLYQRTQAICSEATECCQKPDSEQSEMLWDVLSKQFVSSVKL